MSLHDSAKGYETGASAYVTGRPGYPPEALAWLHDVLGVRPGRSTLDVGAGTGKFLPLLEKCGGRILALEPVAAMRARLIEDFPTVEALSGTAEAIPLPDASVDAVVCAQAFHWFATAAALTEMRRVLMPGGMLGLIWNARDESVPWVAALSAITNPWEGDTPRYRTGAWRRVFPARGFAFIGERLARHCHVGSPERVIVERTLSVSFIAALAPEQREMVGRQVLALIDRTPELMGQETIAFPYETRMFAYRKTE
jgi:ubiquinone/menaquinone biosynthesis C-methylase UbiE